MRFTPVFIVGWCAFLFLYGINTSPLYRTESLRAIIGRECLHGHWLYPVLYGEPFLTKPPGHYVAIGLCSLPYGEVTAETARLPSIFAALGAVVLMHGMFRRVLGKKPALLIAALLPCSILWLDKVPSAEIDMTLVGWVTAAIVLFHRSLETQRHTSLYFLIGALLCVAGGTLTKWTAPAFFYLTVIPLLVWRKQLSFLFGWRHLLAVGVAVCACAGWAFSVTRQVGWDILSDTIRKEAAYRLAPKAGKHYPWGDVVLYPLAVIAAHLPVSAFAILTFRRSFWKQWNDRGKLLLQLLHCWTWPNLLFWTLVPNHNVRYALPMSAGLMGLGVMGLVGWLKRSTPSSTKEGENPRTVLNPSLLAGGGSRRNPWGVHPPKPGGVWEGSEQAEPNPPTPFGSLTGPVSGASRGPAEAEEGEESQSVLSPSPFRGMGSKQSAPPVGRSRALILAFLFCWAVAKVIFVEVALPQRTAGRNAESTAMELREQIPIDQPLYVFKLKDEGITFYYARPVVKLTDPNALPKGAFALLIQQEWKAGAAFNQLKLISCMNDQQGDPIYLVCNP